MISSISHACPRNFFISGIALAANTFATLALAQEFHTVRSPDHKSMVVPTPHVSVGEAVDAPRTKYPYMGHDRPSSDPSVISDVPLTSTQRVSIKISNYPELSADYRINADHTISLPVLGRIPIRNMTPAVLERVVIDKMEKITGGVVHVTVEVAEYRPVFVSGYVAQPGSFPWTPGMTVLKAQALAGGHYRPATNAAGSISGFRADVFRIERITEIKRTTDSLKRTLANHARACAERDELTQVDVPSRLVELVGGAEAQELIDAQTRLLQLRRDTLAAQQARLAQDSALSAKQLTGLAEQRKLLRKQIEKRNEHVNLLRGAATRGNVNRQRVLDAESRLADLEEKSTNIVVANARVLSSIAGLKRDSERLIQDRQLALADEISRLEGDAARLEIERTASLESYAKLTGHEYGSGHDRTRPNISYEITRLEGGKPRTISADRSAPLRPGDILMLSLQAPTGEQAPTQ